jgi:hypothetical protein
VEWTSLETFIGHWDSVELGLGLGLEFISGVIDHHIFHGPTSHQPFQPTMGWLAYFSGLVDETTVNQLVA